MKKDISVILICHKRFRIFEDIIRFWINQPRVLEVLVMDNSGTFKTDLPAIVISTNNNLGPGARVPLVQYARSDKIIFCDDDLELKDGIIEDLEKYWDENTMCGIMGKFWDHSLYKKTKHINGSGLTEPVEVDYVPYNLALIHRKWLTGFDLQKIPDYFFTDDLYYSIKWKQNGMKLLAIPTKNYTQAIENRDENAMHMREDLKTIRQDYYQKWIINKEPLP